MSSALSPFSLLLRKLQLAFFRFAFKILGKMALGLVRLLFKVVLREFFRSDKNATRRQEYSRERSSPRPQAAEPAQRVLEGQYRRLDHS